MLPQPLPSGATLASAPPPPPPPPRLSTAAFSAAALAATHTPPSRRTPTLHIVVVHGTATVPLLRHAHDVLLTLAAKGIHVFLQTEVEVSPPRNVAPITNDTVPDVVAASRADFFVVIADRDLPNRSVQVRLSSAADFVTLPAADLPGAVFESWRLRLHAHHDPLIANALAINPNIVTDGHIHKLLITCADIPHLRRNYAALLKLVNLTHDWEYPARNSSIHNPASLDGPNQIPFEIPKTTDQVSEDAHHTQPETVNAQQHGHICAVDSSTDGDVRQTTCHVPIDDSGADTEELPSGTVPDASKSAAPELGLAADDSRQADPTEPDFCARAKHALQEGLKAILHIHRHTDKASLLADHRSGPRSDLSVVWVNRSTDIPARIVRSQLLLRSVHQRLLSAFDTLTSFPVSYQSSSKAVPKPTHLPSEAHRERLLREINDLLPRVEQVGARLTKRPKTRRRRKRFLESDPWKMYVLSAQASATRGEGARLDVGGCTGDAARTLAGKMWRCYSCLSFNESHVLECTACQSPCCVLRESWIQRNKELLTKRFKDALKTGPLPPTPWVFAPSVLPIQSFLPNGYPDGGLPLESTRRNMPARSPPPNDDRPLRSLDKRGSPVRSHDGNGVHLHQPFDIMGRFKTALSFDDQQISTRNDILRRYQGNGDQIPTRGPPPSRGIHAPSMRPPQGSPVRLASSAPNGPSPLEMDFSRMFPNGRRSHVRAELRSTAVQPRGLNVMKSSLDDHHIGIGMHSSTRTRSSLESEGFPSTFRLGASPARESNASELYSSSLHEKHHQSTLLSTRPGQANHLPIRKHGFLNPGLDELAQGSYTAFDERQKFSSMGRGPASQPISIPSSNSTVEPLQDEITSLEALAAASDAANGGTGSATKESLRAVSAVVTPGRNHPTSESAQPTNGMYNMF